MSKKATILRKAASAVAAVALAAALPLSIGAPTALADDFDPSATAAKSLQWIVSQGEGTTVLTSEKVMAGESVSDWTAFDLALAGMAADNGGAEYLDALKTYVENAYTTEAKLDHHKATEWHRIALVVQALGGDPASFGTDLAGAPINLVADGVYDWNQTSDLGLQGTNAYVYALLVLDYVDAEVPADAKYTADGIVKSLLEAQNADGSWGLSKGSSDIDITAMVLHALAAHQDQPQVASAVDAAVAWLGQQQDADGGFSYDGQPSSESCSQVIIAMCALGLDPENTPELTKGMSTPVSALMGFVLEDGSFSHEQGGSANGMATEQALTALLAMVKFHNTGGDVFDTSTPVCSDLTQLQPSSGVSPVIFVVGGIALLVIIAIVIALTRKKGRN